MENDNVLEKLKTAYQRLLQQYLEGKEKKPDKTSFQESAELLGKTIFYEGKFPFTFDEVKALSSDFMAYWIAENWVSLDDKSRILFLRHISDSFPADKTSRHFQLLLVTKLIDRDPESASRLLALLCNKTKQSKDFPLNKELFSKIRSMLLPPGDFLLTQIQLDKHIPPVKKLAEYAIAATFLNENEKTVTDVNVQLEVMRWLAAAKLELYLPDELLAGITSSEICKGDNLVEFKKIFPLFPDELRKIPETAEKKKEPTVLKSELSKIDAPEVLAVPESLPPTPKTETPKQPAEKEKKTPPKEQTGTKKKFDPLKNLNELQEFIEKKLKETKELEQRIEKYLIERNGYISSLRNATRENEDLKTKNRNLSELIQEKNQKIAELETQVSLLKEDVAQKKSDITKLEEQIASEKEKYEKELNRLSARIDELSKHKKDALINRIRESLRPESQLISTIQNIEMTTQNGEKLRSLINRMFSKLRQEGIFFEGDKL